MTEDVEAEPQPGRRHGRRARRLTPEETAQLEARSSADAEAGGSDSPAAGNGSVSGADAPTPKLRKFGRRARVIELDETPDEARSTATDSAGSTADAVVGAPARAPSRDVDGVELGEVPVGDAPDPRPAPRFDGKVLHRPERSDRSWVVWLVWIVIAVAVIALIVLLVTGVIGGTASAQGTVPDLAQTLYGQIGIDNTTWRVSPA